MLLNEYYDKKMKQLILCSEKFERERDSQKRQFLNNETWRLGSELNNIAHACALFGNISLENAKELTCKKNVKNLRLHGTNTWLFGLQSFIKSQQQ